MSNGIKVYGGLVLWVILWTILLHLANPLPMGFVYNFLVGALMGMSWNSITQALEWDQ